MRTRLGRAAFIALVLAACLGAAIYISTERRLDQRFETPVDLVSARDDETSRARGKHIVRAVAQCTSCHGEDLSGDVAADDWWRGRLDAPNLTPGRGGIAARSNVELDGAIRHGLDPEGRPVLLMPSHTLQVLSNGDFAAVVSYLRSLPAVDREVRPRWVGPFTRLVLFVGAAPEFISAEIIDHARVGLEIAPGPTQEYGEYLVQIGLCRVCHGEDLEGGLHPLAAPDEPPPPRLASGGALAAWSEDDFVAAMRTGRTPDGRVLDERFMPLRVTGRMHDHELIAIWLYLQSLKTPELAAGSTRLEEG
jgi:mono/diheme cytochrome c family protein